MRMIHVPMLAALAACTTQATSPASNSARFQTYPDALFEAFESACGSPAQTFSRLEPDSVECREYLPPEATAALILNFDGTPEDLPELVIRFRAEIDDDGYLVHNDVFVSVPQKSGTSLEVRRRDTKLERTLQKLYERAGGVPD